MSVISLEASIALTGLSRRTVWRRISEGQLQKVDLSETGDSIAGVARTWLEAPGVLRLANLDLDEARFALLERADRGDADAQLKMGQYCYGVKMFEAAVYWFSLSANRDSADAMNLLGRCYAEGIGVNKEEEIALMWVSRAAARGSIIAQKQIHGLRNQG